MYINKSQWNGDKCNLFYKSAEIRKTSLAFARLHNTSYGCHHGSMNLGWIWSKLLDIFHLMPCADWVIYTNKVTCDVGWPGQRSVAHKIPGRPAFCSCRIFLHKIPSDREPRATIQNSYNDRYIHNQRSVSFFQTVRGRLNYWMTHTSKVTRKQHTGSAASRWGWQDSRPYSMGWGVAMLSF